MNEYWLNAFLCFCKPKGSNTGLTQPYRIVNYWLIIRRHKITGSYNFYTCFGCCALALLLCFGTLFTMKLHKTSSRSRKKLQRKRKFCKLTKGWFFCATELEL